MNVRVPGASYVPVGRFGEFADVPDTVVLIDSDGYVSADGVALGRIEKGTRTWERRSRGNRYVNARGQTTEWHGWAAGWSTSPRPDVRADTRREVLLRLLARALRE
jgi:hypothetical protein